MGSIDTLKEILNNNYLRAERTMSSRDPIVSKLKVLISYLDFHYDTSISSLLQSGISPDIVASVSQNKREFDVRANEWLSYLSKVPASSNPSTCRPACEENYLSENLNLKKPASVTSKGSRSSPSTSSTKISLKLLETQARPAQGSPLAGIAR